MILPAETPWRTPARVARSRVRRRVLPAAVALALVMGAVAPAAMAATPLGPSTTAFAGQNTDLGVGGPLGASPSAGSTAGSPTITDDVRDAPAAVLTGTADMDHAGSALIAAGDLNGDGLGDLAYATRNPWRVHIVAGEPGAFPVAPVRTVAGAPGEMYGARLAGGADLNRDGHDDLAIVVGTPQPDGTTVWRVELIFGASTPLIGNQRQSVAAPAMGTTFGSAVALLGDADGDGYGELLVTASPPPGSPAGGKAWVFAGNASGVNTQPAWTFTGPAGSAFGAAAAAAGDLDGDGKADFVVSTGGAPNANGLASVHVFYGASGLALRPPMLREGEQRDDGFGAALGSGDFNGDGFADLAVGAPRFDLGAELPDAGKAYEFRGGAAGLAATAATVRTGAPGQRFATSVAGVGDLNGDAYSDLLLGAPMASADGPISNGQFFAYFGGGSGLSRDYDFTEAGAAGNDLFGAAAAGPGDMNGDGMADLAVAAPGRDAGNHPDAGAVYLYGGARLRLPVAGVTLEFPDLTDGSALARRPVAYHILATAVFRGPVADLAQVELRLACPTVGRSLTVAWAPGGGIAMGPGESDLAELAPDTAVVVSGALKHGQQLSIGIRFAWDIAESDALDAELFASDVAGTESHLSVPGAFRVISRLEFSKPLHVAGADGRDIAPGGYVRTGEVLHWTGGGVVYAGTQVVPATSEFYVGVAGGSAPPTRATVDPVTGDIDARRAAPPESDPGPPGIIQALSGSDLVLGEAAYPLTADGRPVAFGTLNPPAGSKVAESQVEVSVSVTDAGSGVAPASVEFSVSHADPPQFTEWLPATTSGGSPLVAVAAVPLVEGAANFVQFRASDRVGNGPAASPIVQLELDYGAIDFALRGPSAVPWYQSAEVALSFEVTSTRGVPIQLDSLEYMVASPGAGPWVPVGLQGEAPAANFQLLLTLPDGRNAVSLRATLAEGGTYLSRSFAVPVDSTPPVIGVLGPPPGAWLTEPSATSRIFITDPTSGVDTRSVLYRVLPAGATQWSPWYVPTVQVAPSGVFASAAVPVLDGTDNFVEWSASDLAGHGPVRSGYQRILVDTRPVAFGAAMPPDGSQRDSVQRLSIAIADRDGSGVDLSSVEFLVHLPDGRTTPWTSAGVAGVVSEVTVSVVYDLPVGKSVVEWRARDAAGTPLQKSAPVELTVLPPRGPDLAPLLILRSPTAGGEYLTGVDLKLDATPSFDPEGHELTFSWWMDGEPLPGQGPVVWVSPEPGRHAVTVVVSDGTASAVVKTVEFDVVARPAAPGALASPLEQGLVVAVAALALMAVAIRAWADHARRELRR